MREQIGTIVKGPRRRDKCPGSCQEVEWRERSERDKKIFQTGDIDHNQNINQFQIESVSYQ